VLAQHRVRHHEPGLSPQERGIDTNLVKDDPLGQGSVGAIVARNFKRVRTARGVSLAALARHSGVARATLHTLEAGSANPTLETLNTVAGVLGVTLGELVSEDAPPAARVIRATDTDELLGEGFGAHLLRRFNAGPGGTIELYVLRVDKGHDVVSHQHPVGVFEHILVHHGRLKAGPESALVELGPGDYMSFAADQTHEYVSPDGMTVATLLMHYPAVMPASVSDAES
jgi:transcriptional regulator with XRE-family HTH domain